jgi:hypothetical protein
LTGLVFHAYMLAFAVVFALLWGVGWSFIPLGFGFFVLCVDVFFKADSPFP